MGMFHPFQDGDELAAHSPVEAKAEHLRDLIGREAEEPEVAGTLEEFVDGEVATEDEVTAVFDLLKGVVATEQRA
jgi:hypothetical protein